MENACKSKPLVMAVVVVVVYGNGTKTQKGIKFFAVQCRVFKKNKVQKQEKVKENEREKKRERGEMSERR